MADTLLAVDPGVRCCGWALFHDGVFSRCGLRRAKDDNDLVAFRNMLHAMPLCDRQVVERPQVYRQSRSKGNPENLARLLILCGMLAAMVRDTTLVVPHAWKGTIGKSGTLESYIVHKRNVEAVGPGYISADVPKSLAHNAADAVGLGLWYLRQPVPHDRS